MEFLKEAIESGETCPYCDSDYIESQGVPDLDSNSTINYMYCTECSKEWKEVYKLIRIEEVV